jgi:hypothetical protein
MTKQLITRRASLMMIPLLCLFAFSGCQQLAQVLYVIKGHKVAPRFEGLNEKQVAVVCVSDQSAYGPDTLTYSLSKYVSVKLSQGLKKSTVVSPAKIENWMDQHGWDDSNVVRLGKDLKADMVVVIEIGSYSIHEGQTLLKGRADTTVTVYDIEKNGQVAFVDGPDEFVFPENGRPAIQTSERKFETFYLSRLTDRISKLFIEHDKMESFADDAILN